MVFECVVCVCEAIYVDGVEVECGDGVVLHGGVVVAQVEVVAVVWQVWLFVNRFGSVRDWWAVVVMS